MFRKTGQLHLTYLFSIITLVRALDSQSTNLEFKTAGYLQGQFIFLSFQGQFQALGQLKVLKICHVLTDSIVFKQQIYCSFLHMRWLVDGWWVVCERYNCMIPNIKTYYDKKVAFLALVPVLQWNNRHYFLIYVRSKWKVT